MKKLNKSLRFLDNINNSYNNNSISSKDLHDCYSQSFVNYNDKFLYKKIVKTIISSK